MTLAIDYEKQLKKEGDSKNGKISRGFQLVHNFLCIYALTIYGNAERERGDSVYALKTDQGNAYILIQVHIYIREREREREVISSMFLEKKKANHCDFGKLYVHTLSKR